MAIAGPVKPSSETACSTLLRQLQLIWDEVGETDEERDKMLLQIDQECLDVYKRKVDEASKSRILFLQTLADSKSELTRLLSALGEKTVASVPDNSFETIKEQLAVIAPSLEQLVKQKDERMKEFADVQSQIQKIHAEISGMLEIAQQAAEPMVDESDLSLKKLDDFHSQLQELHKEKSDRLHKVLDFVSTVQDLCAVLGKDICTTITEVHPSLVDSVSVDSKSISNDTLSKLAKTVLVLEDDKRIRLEKLQGLASQLCDLWDLMDTPHEERSLFDHVTCNMTATEDDVTVPGALALNLLEQAEIEVERLDRLKANKMKEIAFRKQSELEEIYAHAHIEIDSSAAHEKIIHIINSGNVEPSELIADMDNQISQAKEESSSRKEILEKVERWMLACEEESWIEDYNRLKQPFAEFSISRYFDENRYNPSRGAHLNLKRAEKARILVNKIPALVDTLMMKTQAWETEHSLSFIYDGVPLLAMLKEYLMLRHEREEKNQKMRDKQIIGSEQASQEQEAFGSRLSPSKSVAPKKAIGPRTNGASSNGTPGRRLSTGSGQASSNGVRSMSKEGKRESTKSARNQINRLITSKEDSFSQISASDAVSASP